LADLNQVLRLEPQNDRARIDRADAYRALHQCDKAVAEYTAVIKADSNSIDAYVKRGDAYREAKQWEKAIADYSQAVRLDPGSSSAVYESRAKAYEQVGNAGLAEKDRQKAQALRRVDAMHRP
jgi:tetratricopeptide (TPR) repeat protein